MRIRVLHAGLRHYLVSARLRTTLPTSAVTSLSSSTVRLTHTGAPPVVRRQITQDRKSWLKSLLALAAATAFYFTSASTSPSLSAESSTSEEDLTKPIYKRLPKSATPAEREAVTQLRVSLEAYSNSLSPELRSYVRTWALTDDWCLLRYCRAHKLNVQRAQNGLLATATWRLKEGVDNMKLSDFDSKWTPSDTSMYVSSETDLQGRSMVVYKKSSNPSVGWNPEVYRLEILALAYCCERAIRAMEDRVARGEVDPEAMDYKWIFWIDVGKYNKSSATPWHVTRDLVDVMRLHYPERLHRGLIIDAPWLLTSLLKLLKPFIDKVTRDKILFLHDRNSQKTKEAIEGVLGDIGKLATDSGVDGASTQFDYQLYKRTDPLAMSREESLRFDPNKFFPIHTSQVNASTTPTEASKFDAKAVSEKLRKLAFWRS